MFNTFNKNINKMINELLFTVLYGLLIILSLYILSLIVIFFIKLKKDNNKFRAFSNSFKQLNANLFYFIRLKNEINSVLNNKEVIYGPKNQTQSNLKKIKLGLNWITFDKDTVEVRLKPKGGIAIDFFEDSNNRAVVQKIIASKYKRYDFSTLHGTDITYILNGRKR